MNRIVDDTQCIAEWVKLLKIFKLVIKDNPKPEAVKKELEDLKEVAKNSIHLTFHQKDAIVARCDNYMNGEYGNTKTAANINFSQNGTT